MPREELLCKVGFYSIQWDVFSVRAAKTLETKSNKENARTASHSVTFILKILLGEAFAKELAYLQ